MAFKKTSANKKPTLTFLILKTIFNLGAITTDSFFPAKYPQARIWRQLLGLNKSYKFSRQSFAVILSRLQKQRLIVRQNGTWSITSLGKKIIGESKFRQNANCLRKMARRGYSFLIFRSVIAKNVYGFALNLFLTVIGFCKKAFGLVTGRCRKIF